MRIGAGVLVLVMTLAACGTDDGVEGESALPAGAVRTADSLSAEQQRARRDSAVAGSRLPGAAGVGRAMDASEAARARNESMDSIQ